MKKVFKGLTICLACFALLFVITGCGNKKSLTSEEFITKLKDSGYSIQDATGQFAGYDNISQVTLAISPDSSYQIEFYELSNSDNAVAFFNNNKTKFENSKGSASAETSVDIGNHSKYTLLTDGYYKLVSRINNTVIYLNVPASYKSNVNKVLKEIDY